MSTWILLILLWVCMWSVCLSIHEWRSKDNFQESGSLLSPCVYLCLNSGTFTWWALSLAQSQLLVHLEVLNLKMEARLVWPSLVKYMMNFKTLTGDICWWDGMWASRLQVVSPWLSDPLWWSAAWSPPFQGQCSLTWDSSGAVTALGMCWRLAGIELHKWTAACRGFTF